MREICTSGSEEGSAGATQQIYSNRFFVSNLAEVNAGAIAKDVLMYTMKRNSI